MYLHFNCLSMDNVHWTCMAVKCNNELWCHIETNWTSWYFILKRMLQLHPVDRKCTGLRVWIKSAQFFQSLDFAHFCLAYYKSNHIQLNYIDRRRRKTHWWKFWELESHKMFLHWKGEVRLSPAYHVIRPEKSSANFNSKFYANLDFKEFELQFLNLQQVYVPC